MRAAQEVVDLEEQAYEDDPADSGASFTMDDTSEVQTQPRNQWFPLRPSAVGEDDEDTGQVTYAASTAVHGPNTDRLQDIPLAWSDDDSKQSPPERSQPDGRDGPDVRRTPWIGTTHVSSQQAVSPPLQTPQPVSGTTTSKDSGSDVSVSSQPNGDHNITPLDIITRSIPPAKNGASLIAELRQRHAPQLNSDSDTESPVSKLLGPNFRAVQEVLDRLKQDRLTDSVSDEADDAVSEGHSVTDESVQSIPSVVMRAANAGSTGYGVELTSEPPSCGTKPPSLVDEIKVPEGVSSRVPQPHNGEQAGNGLSMGYGLHRLSDSDITIAKRAWDTRRVSSFTSPADPVPKSTAPDAMKSSVDVMRHTSTNALARITGADYRPLPSDLLDGRPSTRQLPPRLSSIDAAPTLTAPAAQKSSIDLIRLNSAASSATNAQIAGREYPLPPSEDDSEHVLHRELLDSRSISLLTLPPPLLPSPDRYLPEQSSRSSVENSLRSSRIAWGEHHPPPGADVIHRPNNETLSSTRPISQERELTSRSSLGRSIPTSTGERGLPVSAPQEFPNHRENVVGLTVISVGDLAFPGQTSSGTRPISDDHPVGISKTRERSDDLNITGQGQEQISQSGSSFQHLRSSDRSASSDDTDDLLNYEPVMEGDRQYLRMQKGTKRSEKNQRQSGGIENRGNTTREGSSRGLHTVGNAVREQSLSTLQSQDGKYITPSEMDDSHIKSLHWSLGAGTISPISVTGLSQMDSLQEKSSTPLGPASERSSVLGHGTLQEQSLDEDETPVQIEDRDAAVSRQTRSRSTTDVSSSDEIYRPILHRDAAIKENRPKGSVLQPSPYGIYDIRRSSGPGSTNRRRKALGLDPNPTRETASQNGAGMVYISGSSTPSSGRDGRYFGTMEDLARRTSAQRNAPSEKDHYEESLESIGELMRPKAKAYQPVRDPGIKIRQSQDARDQYQDGNLSHEQRKSRTGPVTDSLESHSTTEKRIASGRHSHLPGKHVDKTDPNATRGTDSTGKSRRSTDDSLTFSSRQEKARKSRKHTDAKTRHRSRDGGDHGSKSTRLDSNISKLSSLISKSIDENISSSSQASVIPTSRWSSSKRRKHRMTSSSESSDVSEFFNYAFMEPRLRSSIKHKIRLRELLKSVKSHDFSPIVRAPDTTTTESTSCVSSNEGGERETNGEREQQRESEPPPAEKQPWRAEAFDVPFFTSRPADLEPRCTCSLSQKGAAQLTVPAKTRTLAERKGDDGAFWSPRKRDIGVNCPTPAIIRSPTSSIDECVYTRFEDASTQTENIASGSKIDRKIEAEAVKSQRKKVKSPRGDIEERGVISQTSPKKSDYIYSVDHREVRHKPKERLIPSQNSPDHSAKTTSERTSRAQVPAWFHPLSIKPQSEQIAFSHLKTPSRSRSNDEFRVDVFDAAVNPSSSLQKLSLQEAFLYAKSQFIKRSQDRVARIEQAALEKEKRKMIAEAAAEEKRIEASKTKGPKATPDAPKITTPVKSASKCRLFR